MAGGLVMSNFLLALVGGTVAVLATIPMVATAWMAYRMAVAGEALGALLALMLSVACLLLSVVGWSLVKAVRS